MTPARHRSGGGLAGRLAVWRPGLAVALGAAVATVHGLYEVAVAAGVRGGIAGLYPLITDGLALVAYPATARLTGSARRYAWLVVALAAGLSGLAQAAYLAGTGTPHPNPASTAAEQPVFAADPALRFGVGAWPAIAAASGAHLLYLLAVDHPADHPADRAGHDTADDAAAATAPRDPTPVPVTDGDSMSVAPTGGSGLAQQPPVSLDPAGWTAARPRPSDTSSEVSSPASSG